MRLRWLIVALLLATIAGASVLGAPAFVFVPADALNLYRTPNDDFLASLDRMQRRGVAACFPAGADSRIGPHMRINMSCDIDGFAWRRARIRVAYILCYGGPVRIETIAIQGFAVDQQKSKDIGARPCPGDDVIVETIP